MDRVTGVLSVTTEVTLQADNGSTYQVIVLPLQAAIGWDAIVARSVEAFRHDHGHRVTLEGDLHGNMLASARRASDVSARPGMFRGRVESDSGSSLDVELRFEGTSRIVSADFFRNGTFYCSMRARVSTSNGTSVATSPRFIFDTQSESNIGGRLECTVRSDQVVEVTCIIPEAFPDEYRGELASVSDFYRTLDIEVDKLDGLPWPPEFSTRDIPEGHQPSDLSDQDVSLAALFRQAGIDARVHHNDGALAAATGALTGRPGEEDRWDEREMHEMMDTNYSRNLSDREWWLYLLIVTRFDGGPSHNAEDGTFSFDSDGHILNDGVGTTGIIFDHRSGNIRDPWSPFFEWFSANAPQFRHLFDFGRGGSFANTRARQGVAVFWREMLDFVDVDEQWYRNRQFLRTIVHELGHALNLAHAWLVGRPDTTSFMMYPQRYPHGSTYDERVVNYWRDFDYKFDPEEIFHFRHGFYHEIIPGGRLQFMQWTQSSVFRDPTAGGTRANIALNLSPTRGVFQFTEPVTVEVSLRNHTAQGQPVGRLSPAYGDTKFVIRKPNGAIEEYHPPLVKCEWTKQTLDANATRKHVTSLAVGNQGFVFDTPGRYEITASIPDPSTGALVIARPISVWVRYPTDEDEDMASRIFNRESALFLYMGGGDHLTKGRDALAEAAECHPSHPLSAHANLVLGLNELSGQKSVVQRRVKPSQPSEALPLLKRALKSPVFSTMTQRRLKSTISLLEPEDKPRRPRQTRK